MPKVYNGRDERNKNFPKDAVWVDRRTRFGNPYIMRSELDRNLVCDAFEDNILPNLDVTELKGKDLICWCAPKRCHADAILRKANKE